MKSTAEKLGEKLAVAKDRLMLQECHVTQKSGEMSGTISLHSKGWPDAACSLETVEGAEWRAGLFDLTCLVGKSHPCRTQVSRHPELPQVRYLKGMMQKDVWSPRKFSTRSTIVPELLSSGFSPDLDNALYSNIIHTVMLLGVPNNVVS